MVEGEREMVYLDFLAVAGGPENHELLGALRVFLVVDEKEPEPPPPAEVLHFP